MSQKLFKIIIIILAATVVSFLFSQNPLLALLVCLGLLLSFLIFWRLEIGLILVILSLLVGQVVRIPLPGTETYFLPNDFFIPLLFLACLARKAVRQRMIIPKNPVNLPLFLFLGMATVSLIWGSRNLTGQEIFVSLLYLVRFMEYAFLFYCTIDVVKSKKEITQYMRLIFFVAAGVAVLGFFQYFFVPDFSLMAARAGWDPHVKRLLSTWFDPNFVGGFLVFVLSFVLSFLIYMRARKERLWLLALSLILFAALVLTYSRSAFLALVCVILILGLLKSRKLLVVGFIAILLLVAFSGRLQTRLAGATQIDVTAQYRITSWKNTLEIVRDNPFLGIGFNAFKYAQLRYGTIGPEASHSDFGSDSSFLTILATTGILGFGVYLWLLGSMFVISWRAFRLKNSDDLSQALGLGMLAGLIAMVLHSQFTNSLLYPYFLELIWLFLAITVVSIRGEKQEVK